MSSTKGLNRDIASLTRKVKKNLVDITPFNIGNILYETDKLFNNSTFDYYTKIGGDAYCLSNDIPLIFRSFRAPRLKKLFANEQQYELFSEFEEKEEIHNLVFCCDIKYKSKEKRKKEISIYIKNSVNSKFSAKPTKFAILKNERKEDVGVIFVMDISRMIGLNGKSYWKSNVLIKPEYGDKQIDLFYN